MKILRFEEIVAWLKARELVRDIQRIASHSEGSNRGFQSAIVTLDVI